MSDATRICAAHRTAACDPHMHTHTDTHTDIRSGYFRREMTLSYAREKGQA